MIEEIGARVGRIVSGTVDMLVEAMEQKAPEMVLEEAMREIDSAIVEIRCELGQAVARKQIATIRVTEQQGKAQELNQKIEWAVKQNRDDLAEAAISRQLDLEAQIPILEHAMEEGSNREKVLEGYIAALQGKKRELREDLRAFRETHAPSTTMSFSPSTTTGLDSGVEAKVARAESAFDQVLEKATSLLAIELNGDGVRQAKVADLEKLARQHRIQERLAAVKKKPWA